MSRRDKIEQMLLKEPDDVFLNFSLAMELAKAGGTEPALQRFDRVIELNGNYTAAYYHKGNALIGLGRSDDARQVLSAGVDACSRTGDTHALSEMTDLLNSIG